VHRPSLVWQAKLAEAYEKGEREVGRRRLNQVDP
jgi:hypothetical protein